MVKRNIAGLGTAAKTSAGSVNFLRRALVGLGGVLVLTSSIRTIAQFEQALSSVRAIAKATESQFIDLRDTARDLGATTRFTATQAAEGLLFLARAGFTVKESLTAIRPTLNLAQAGALDLGRAADIASNIMRGFRLDMDQAENAMDILALAATSSNTNIQQLGDALKFVAPVAAGLGITLEETAAAIGALSDAGLQASLAGTGLRRVMAELESPSKKTEKILREFGISVADVRVSTVGLTQALIVLRDAGVDAGKGMEIFGQRGGPAFEVLKSSIPDVVQMNEALLNAGGTADRIARIMDDNLNGALLRVRSAYEAVILSFGQIRTSLALRGVLDALADALRFLARNIEIVQFLLLGLAVAVIPKVILGLRALTLAIAGTGFGAVVVGIGLAVGALVAFRDEILVSGDGVTSLGDLTQAVFERIQETVTILVNAIGDLFGDQFLSGFEFTLADLGMLFEIFVRTTAGTLDALLGAFVGLRRAIEASFNGLPDTLLEVVIAAVNGLIGIVEGGIDQTLALFQTLGDTTIRIVKQINLAFLLLSASAQSAIAGNFAEAQRLGDEAAFQLRNGLVDAIEDVPRLLAENFERLSETDLLPRIKNVADGAGKEFADDFLAGFAEGMEESTVFADSVDDIFSRAQEISRSRLLQEQEAGLPGGAPTPGDPARQGKTPEELRREAFSVMAGIERGFDTLEEQITDFASLTESSMVRAFNEAEDALVQFVQTGELEFSSLIDSVLADLTRLLARQALVALLGAVSGGSTGALVTVPITARKHGGTVEAGETVLLGEEGPELFSPTTRGTITPAGPTAAMMAPQAPPVVNVQIVNVTDPDEVTSALATPEGQEAVLNVIRRNPRAMREIL